MSENVYSSAKIVNIQEAEKFELISFIKNDPEPEMLLIDNTKEDNTKEKVQDKEIEELKEKQREEEIQKKVQEEKALVVNEIVEKIDPILQEVQNLTVKLNEISSKVTSIEEEGNLKGKDFDEQIVKAIKDLKQYALFFEQATLQMEAKMFKTSLSIAKKIINIEIGENSSKIAKETISQLLNKLKHATKVKIHLNPKDYYILKNELSLEPYIELSEDSNIVAGGVVISSDIGNFDGNIDTKISSMYESLDLLL